MDRLMPIQTFSPEAVQRILGKIKPLSELALDDDVNGRVKVDVWKLHANPAVIFGDRVEPLGLFKREPLLRVRCHFWIVFHLTLCFMRCHALDTLTLLRKRAGYTPSMIRRPVNVSRICTSRRFRSLASRSAVR